MESLTVIYIGIIIYLAGMLGVGIYASKKISGTEDFLVAGRRLPLWLCTAALTATFFGGGTIMGAGGAAYKKGFLGVIADPFGAALCLSLAGLFFIRIMRRMRLTTIVDFFEIRFGKTSGVNCIHYYAICLYWLDRVSSCFPGIYPSYHNWNLD
jgi:Na+/proline symporter